MSLFQKLKYFLMSLTGLSKDALHIYVGLAIFFATVVFLRQRMSSLWPILLVVLAAIAGEVLDMRDDLNMLGHWRWKASLHDFLNTLFWPTAIWLMAYLRVMRVN